MNNASYRVTANKSANSHFLKTQHFPPPKQAISQPKANKITPITALIGLGSLEIALTQDIFILSFMAIIAASSITIIMTITDGVGYAPNTFIIHS
jgi:hypothetical protein